MVQGFGNLVLKHTRVIFRAAQYQGCIFVGFFGHFAALWPALMYIVENLCFTNVGMGIKDLSWMLQCCKDGAMLQGA
jgi:hypothetical protein